LDRDLTLALSDAEAPHALDGWMKADAGQWIDVHPAHWREPANAP